MAKNIRVTYSYCPPNILNLSDRNAEISFDEKFDVWSFGTILYEMIFKKVLFDRPNPQTVTELVNKFHKQ